MTVREYKIKAIFKTNQFETGDQLQNKVHEQQGKNCSRSVYKATPFPDWKQCSCQLLTKFL